MRRLLVRTRWVGLCACAAGLLAGCGTATGGTSAVVVSGNTLLVYGSQPPGGSGGQPASDVLDAERLALQQAGGKAGSFTVKFHELNGRLLSDNARTAIQDKRAIAYLGELQPGTSQIATEILNQQGLLVISPGDTAGYLTQPIPPVSTTTSTYYPAHSTYQETFARVVPNSGMEAKALVQEMQAEHVSSLFVSSDTSQYGKAIALQVKQAAQAAGLTLASQQGSADGIFYGASVTSPDARTTATKALDAAASASPSAKLFAPSGLYDDPFVAGLSPGAQARLVVSSPGFLPQDLTPAGQTFVSDFKTAYGHAPDPQAIFGFAAMADLLSVLDKAGAQAGNRADVVHDFRTLSNPPNSALGSYSISGGDPSIAPFIFGQVKTGKLVPFKFVQLPV
jgi:branched-chain amino acid transport system substrate-binding protein